MSGALFTAFSAGGFAKSLVASIISTNTREIIWPLIDQNGAPVQGPTPNGSTQSGQIGGYVAILEEHRDEMEITKHPVEQGAQISDHAFKLGAQLTMQIGWSPSSYSGSGLPNILGVAPIPFSGIASLLTGLGGNSLIKSTYSQMLRLQAQRTLLTVYTGKRKYDNMLITMLAERTQKETENSLVLTLALEEVLIANVSVVNAPINQTAQAAPQSTTPSSNQGQQTLQPGTQFNAAVIST